MTYKALVFDMDGTLLNTLADLAAATNKALQSHGYAKQPVDAFRFFVGSGARNLIRRALPEIAQTEANVEACLETFETFYQTHWDVHTHLYDGIAELLDEATERNLPMAVLTNKPQAFANHCVKRFLSRWSWRIVQGQQPHLAVKPSREMSAPVTNALNVSPEDVLYIGDSDVDMQTARNAGYKAVGVSWGFRPEQELIDSGAEVIIHQPTELWSVFQS